MLGDRGAHPSKSIHADYSSLTDLRPPVKLTREERRRRRGRVGRCGWLTARVTAMPGRLQTILPAAWRGEEEGGFGEATGVRGAGVPAPDWPTGEDGEVQGAPWCKGAGTVLWCICPFAGKLEFKLSFPSFLSWLSQPLSTTLSALLLCDGHGTPMFYK